MDQTRQLHNLMLTFMGLYHQKFMVKFRHDSSDSLLIKKNPGKIIKLLYYHSPLTLTEIGKSLDIEKGSLTTLVDQLELSNLVLRSDDPSDRRKFLVSLSPLGQAKMDQFIHDYTDKLKCIFSNVPAAELELFFVNLQSVIDFMEKVEG